MELKKLEEVAGDFDFLVQEGVIYSQKDIERAYFLLGVIEEFIDTLSLKAK
jgi:hypothetical protein